MDSSPASQLPNHTSLSHSGALLNFFDSPNSQVFAVIVTIGLVWFTLLGLSLWSQDQDGREPPVYKPRIPFLGHFIGFMRQQTMFLPGLSRLNIPIATLPILSGKLYAVWDANLIQAVYRNKNVSYDPILIQNARGALGLDEQTQKTISQDELIHDYAQSVHKAMLASEVSRMNTVALKHITSSLRRLNSSGFIEIPNLYHWLRELLTTGACEALYGPSNPISGPELIGDIWTWDDNLMPLVMNVFPALTARSGYLARGRLQAALSKYYAAHGDSHEDASHIARGRADVLRKHGIPDETVGVIEIGLLHAAAINTVPVLFWLVAFIITRPKVMQSLREELVKVPAFDQSRNTATLDIDALADTCPLLVSSYKETLRLCDSAQVPRRVLADTTISDSQGRSYLLKKGMDVHMPSYHLNKMESIWGPDVSEFRADRFLESVKLTPEATRTRRISYNPFGGGKHKCPGRSFAQAEILGFVISFLLSYDVYPLDGDWDKFQEPKMDNPPLTTPISLPVKQGDGFGVKIQRRAGWENVTWKITSGRKVDS